MFLGAGFSSCSTVVAALAGLEPWEIPQVHCVKQRNISSGKRKGIFTVENKSLQLSHPMPGADKFIKPLSGVVMLFDRERFIGKWQKPNFYRSLWLIDLCFLIQQNIPKGITGNNSRIPVNSSSRNFIGRAGDFPVIELIHNRSNSIALTWFYPYFLSTMSRTLQCFSLRLWNKLRRNRRIL